MNDIGNPGSLPAHVARMIDEQRELAGKLAALNRFIRESPVFHTLPTIEQSDMMDQRDYMQMYEHVLERRINRAKKETVE